MKFLLKRSSDSITGKTKPENELPDTENVQEKKQLPDSIVFCFSGTSLKIQHE